MPQSLTRIPSAPRSSQCPSPSHLFSHRAAPPRRPKGHDDALRPPFGSPAAYGHNPQAVSLLTRVLGFGISGSLLCRALGFGLNAEVLVALDLGLRVVGT